MLLWFSSCCFPSFQATIGLFIEFVQFMETILTDAGVLMMKVAWVERFKHRASTIKFLRAHPEVMDVRALLALAVIYVLIIHCK